MHPPMAAESSKRPAALWVLIGLLVFQGISAAPPGFLLVLDPTGGLLHLPLDLLKDASFRNFLIPGLILFVVLGIGAFFIAAGLFFLPDWMWIGRLNLFIGQHWAWTAAVAFGPALMIWIVVQVIQIGLGTWLQPFYFGVGLVILLLALNPSVQRHLRVIPTRVSDPRH